MTKAVEPFSPDDIVPVIIKDAEGQVVGTGMASVATKTMYYVSVRPKRYPGAGWYKYTTAKHRTLNYWAWPSTEEEVARVDAELAEEESRHQQAEDDRRKAEYDQMTEAEKLALRVETFLAHNPNCTLLSGMPLPLIRQLVEWIDQTEAEWK